MSDNAKARIAQAGNAVQMTCLECQEHSKGKSKFYVYKFETQQDVEDIEAGTVIDIAGFQPMQVGKVYSITIKVVSKPTDAVVKYSASRPPSTEEEREARKKKEADERAAYEADNAKRGIQTDGAAANVPAAQILEPSQQHVLLAKQYGFTPGDVRLMEANGIVPPNTPISQVEFFFRTAQLHGLNPLAKQVYMLPFGPQSNRKYAIVISIDSARSKATQTNQYCGKNQVLYDGLPVSEWIRTYNNRRKFVDKQVTKTFGNKTWTETETHLEEGEFPQVATVTVKRMIGGNLCEFTMDVLWDEYYPGPSGRGSMWRDRPFGQLGKCAEMLALRAAFADALGKLYISEEFDRASAASEQNPEAKDVGYIDWDAVLKTISSITDINDLRSFAANHPLKEDAEFMEAVANRFQELSSEAE